MIAKENVYIPNDDELMQFSDLLTHFQVPVNGKVRSKYGWRRGRMHTGTDLTLNLGDTVYAAYNGIVFRACRYYGYGNLVIVKHPLALETYYGHLSKFLVKAGDTIKVGQPLGLGGRTGRSTGPHLHFEIRENRVAYNPELVYDFPDFKVRNDICDKGRMADLITNPKTGENISITRKGTSYLQEMGTSQVVDYVIKAGDSLWDIARKCNTSVSIICELNSLTTGSILKIGKVLKISGQPVNKLAVRPVAKTSLQVNNKSLKEPVSKPQVKATNPLTSQEVH
jgi:LysM repeat protein